MNIDLSYLEDITGGDKEMTIEMLDLFIEDIPTQVSKIHELAKDKELLKLGAESHKLKPTLQYVGLFNMYEVVKRLEELGKSGAFSDDIIELVNSLVEFSKEAVPLLVSKRMELV